MALTKYKLGDLITVVDERNSEGIREFYGININKEFMPTVANTDGLDEKKYKVIRKNRFVYSGMQTGRDECIRISMYTLDAPIIVSPAYTTFEVTATDVVEPMFFFMMFLSKEKDRLGWFYSDSSIRSNLDWDRFCDIDIELPSLPIQQKYVEVYKSMLANQQCYERGLEDLKLVCDAYIENLRRKMPCEPIGKYLIECDEKNDDLSVTLAQGVDVNMQFIPAKREAVDKESTRIVRNGQFAFNKVVKSNGTKLPIALRRGPDCIISGSYQVFEVSDKENLIPEYLMLWMSRPETQRFCGFNAWGSTRDVFPFSELAKLEFPIPSTDIQQDIVNIYNAYIMRKDINERLKSQIKNICPILIKGSLEEASKTLKEA
jgi:type I restriction enzyme S subunit